VWYLLILTFKKVTYITSGAKFSFIAAWEVGRVVGSPTTGIVKEKVCCKKAKLSGIGSLNLNSFSGKCRQIYVP